MKELSVCQSCYCPDLVSFPVLSQIKPQAPVFFKYEVWLPPPELLQETDYILSSMPFTKEGFESE